jgi:CRP/FNR family transcriptional activator FtrB
MRAEDAEVIRRLPLFEGMEQANFEALIAAGYLQRFPAGVVLVHEGERPDFLHVLVEGSIEFFSRHDGRETTISLLSPPSAFILAAVVVDDVYLKSARTLITSTVVLIPAQAVREVFGRDPAFSRATVVELACRYRTVVKDLKNQRLRSAIQRLANWIVVQDQQSGGKRRFRMPVEKRVVANQLGMRPENLSRALADLAEIGVTVKGPLISIADYNALIEFARPNPLIDDPDSADDCKRRAK